MNSIIAKFSASIKYSVLPAPIKYLRLVGLGAKEWVALAVEIRVESQLERAPGR
jgi:hypothetical protein